MHGYNHNHITAPPRHRDRPHNPTHRPNHAIRLCPAGRDQSHVASHSNPRWRSHSPSPSSSSSRTERAAGRTDAVARPCHLRHLDPDRVGSAQDPPLPQASIPRRLDHPSTTITPTATLSTSLAPVTATVKLKATDKDPPCRVQDTMATATATGEGMEVPPAVHPRPARHTKVLPLHPPRRPRGITSPAERWTRMAGQHRV